MNVIKRDKTIEVFQVEKIFSAVEKAFESCKSVLPEELKQQLSSLYDENAAGTVSVEEIQDEVENALLCEYPDVASAVNKIVKVKERIWPDAALVAKYEEQYQKFKKMYPTVKNLF